jgi:hypothetical protein
MSRGLISRNTMLFVAVGLSAGAIGPSVLASQAPGAAASCGPSTNSRTLASSRTVRIFGTTSQAESKVYACSKPSGKAWRLGPHPVKGWGASMPGPFAIQGKWAAGIERRQVGRDTTEIFSSARNASSGKARPHCLIGGADRPGQLPKTQKAFVTPSGTVVWVASIRAGDASVQIRACEGTTSRMVAEGDGIDPNSAFLEDYRLSWKDDSGEHFETLH